ncbi:unnamed protein product [Notodromas monacha]|uniref:Uncharacterized protein n=1 Tax=Notodromas monacha TaxID=399045 RepID=A0A7R9BTF0_9CRUS|nr:unnamed protein product [Notodromas monacha]CAG0921429.1 unnamed protein product [Notodromas monacha]
MPMSDFQMGNSDTVSRMNLMLAFWISVVACFEDKNISQYFFLPLRAFSKDNLEHHKYVFQLVPQYKVFDEPEKSFKPLYEEKNVLNRNRPYVKVSFRGIWVIHVVSEKDYMKGMQDIINPNGDIIEDTYFLAGTDKCQGKISKEVFRKKELLIRSFGNKENWMSRPLAIFFSKPKFQGKQITIELFKNHSFTKVEEEHFYPKSSIVVNSNWNIMHADGDSFCLLGDEDVLYISDWEAAGYSSPTDGAEVEFPMVFPGCIRRPFQVPVQPLDFWHGRLFCYIDPETESSFFSSKLHTHVIE